MPHGYNLLGATDEVFISFLMNSALIYALACLEKDKLSIVRYTVGSTGKLQPGYNYSLIRIRGVRVSGGVSKSVNFNKSLIALADVLLSALPPPLRDIMLPSLRLKSRRSYYITL